MLDDHDQSISEAAQAARRDGRSHLIRPSSSSQINLMDIYPFLEVAVNCGTVLLSNGGVEAAQCGAVLSRYSGTSQTRLCDFVHSSN